MRSQARGRGNYRPKMSRKVLLPLGGRVFGEPLLHSELLLEPLVLPE